VTGLMMMVLFVIIATPLALAGMPFLMGCDAAATGTVDLPKAGPSRMFYLLGHRVMQKADRS
jgi:hypothetical protein